MQILALDPGIAITGFSILEKSNSKITLKEYGTIKTFPYQSLEDRIFRVFDSIQNLLKEGVFHSVALEKIFFTKNIKTAAEVLQAKGAMVAAIGKKKLSIANYSPTQIKKTICGNGKADKKQVQFMVEKLLGFEQDSLHQDDAIDAIAIGICHLTVLGKQVNIV